MVIEPVHVEVESNQISLHFRPDDSNPATGKISLSLPVKRSDGGLARLSRGDADPSRPPTGQHFADRLVERARGIGSRLIVGLDPDVERFPGYLRQRFAANPSDRTLEDVIVQFHEAVIEATAPCAAAYKPQAAFYEQYGYAGIRALHRTIVFLRDRGLPILLDAKRNDIEHTAGAYGRAWLGQTRPLTGEANDWRVDALTINGYLGIDGIRPFLEADPHAGLFVLAKTSNPSSGEFQDLRLADGGGTNFERMAELAESWGRNTIGASGYARIGLVVGATYPEASQRLRRIAPSALFLMPGVGAQGAGFDSVAMGCGGKDGWGAFAASSRSVLYGFDKSLAAGRDTWRDAVKDAARTEAERIRDGVQAALDEV
ncbi:MAG: orotidine-5'-phosphate decarboxylase [Alphaproteobacteria bacterium]